MRNLLGKNKFGQFKREFGNEKSEDLSEEETYEDINISGKYSFEKKPRFSS